MKKSLYIATAMAGLVLMVSCAGIGTEPMGFIYTDVTGPVTACTGNGSKVGTSKATSYVGIIAVGDASIDTAKRSAGINNVTSVDIKRENILGIVATYTTTVRGN